MEGGPEYCLSPSMDVKVLPVLVVALWPLPSHQQAGWTSLSQSESEIDGRYQDKKEPNLSTTSRDSNDGWTSLLETYEKSHRDGRLVDDNKKVSRQC